MSFTKWESKIVGQEKISVPVRRKANSLERRKILVVDDNEIILHVIRCILEDAGYEVATAGSGMAALDALRQKDFELIITDLVMPGMDGISLLKQAKALYPDLPAIMVTGSPDRVRKHLANVNIDTLLTKPLYREDLLDRVDYCLNRHDPEAANMRRAV